MGGSRKLTHTGHPGRRAWLGHGVSGWRTPPALDRGRNRVLRVTSRSLPTGLLESELRVCGRSLVRQGQARVSLGPSGPQRFPPTPGHPSAVRKRPSRRFCPMLTQLYRRAENGSGDCGLEKAPDRALGEDRPRGRTGLRPADPASGIHGPGGPRCLGPLRCGCPGSVGC